MDDQFGKYIRLFGTLFFTLIGFILSLLLLMLGLRLFFGLLSYIPWFTYIYMIFIIMVPAALFISVFIVYMRRTAFHPSRIIRYISYTLFSIALIAWAVFLFLDLKTFFTHAYVEIGKYYSYNMPFLASNVACIFLVGVMQAFTTAKEKDWMERAQQD
ncbi:MAG TPA: hypothetical protein PLC48_04005 [Ferruginibacter sp.]|nr:hypothetical protein [Ferruginibacter sp.]